KEKGLTWVAEQVEDEIKLGKARPERISVPAGLSGLEFDNNSIVPIQRTRRTAAEFVGRDDYTPLEKFALARGAISTVVLGGLKIQDALMHLLAPEDADREIHFVPGETGTTSHSYRRATVDERRSVITQLELLLEQLDADVNDAD